MEWAVELRTRIDPVRFAYPSQRIQDWLSQQWCIWRGRRFDPQADAWLAGPYGQVDAIGDAFIDGLATAEGLVVQRNVREAGLLQSIDALGLGHAERRRLQPGIAEFYQQTSRYALALRFGWNPFFQSGGWLINVLFGDRLKQLNFPLDQREFASGIHSEVITLSDPHTNQTKRTIWYRTVRSTGRVLYAGIYTTCCLPSGEHCVKVIFPLPRGNATVIMRPQVDADGRLRLVSAGERFGDPGFYFLLSDSRGGHWAQYIRSFRECLTVAAPDDGHIRAHHTISLWRQPVVRIRYQARRRSD